MATKHTNLQQRLIYAQHYTKKIIFFQLHLLVPQSVHRE